MTAIHKIILLFITISAFSFLSELSADPATCLTPQGGSQPAFFPDGKHLLFVGQNKEGDSILFIKALQKNGVIKSTGLAGEAPIRLTDSSVLVYKTGSFIAPKLMLFNPETGKASHLKTKSRISGSIIPLGNGKITYPSGFGRKTRQVAFDLKQKKEITKVHKLPKGISAISRDGKLAAVSSQTNTGETMFKIINLKTGKTIFTATPPRSAGLEVEGCHSPVFSPDGRFVAYVKGGIQPVADIEMLNLKTGKITPVTTDKADNRSPVFSPNGSLLAYCSTKGGKYQIWLKKLD